MIIGFDVVGVCVGEVVFSYVVIEMVGDVVGDNCGLGFGEYGSFG